MSIWVSWFIASFMFNIAYCYIFNRLFDYKKNIISYKLILCSIIFSFIEAFIINYGHQGLRIIFILLFMCVIFKINFNIQMSKIITGTFVIYLLFALSEVIYAFICFYLLKVDSMFLQQTSIGIFITNIVILIIVFGMMKIKSIWSKIKPIVEWYAEKSLVVLLTLILYSFFSLFALMTYISNNLISNSTFIICIVFIFSIIIFIFLMLRENADKNKIYNEYDNLLNYVDNYGKVIDEKSKEMHEYKNQLIIIKGLILNRNKKAQEYIDNILNNQLSNNKYTQTKSISSIPLNGIRGLLYYKINEMIEKNVEVYVDIKLKTKSGSVWKLCEQKMSEISKIMGIYLDNAIQASSVASKKYAIIELIEEKDK